MNPGNAGQAENRMVRGVSREAVPNPQEAGARSAVSAICSGRRQLLGGKGGTGRGNR